MEGGSGAISCLIFILTKTDFPSRASEFVERQNLKGNLFTSDLWGGYLIYRNPRRYKVFFDGRSDMYGESFVKEYSGSLCSEFQLERCADEVSHCLDSGSCGFEPVDRPGGIHGMGVSL